MTNDTHIGVTTIAQAAEQVDDGGRWDPTCERTHAEALAVLAKAAGTYDVAHRDAERITQRILDALHGRQDTIRRMQQANRDLRERVKRAERALRMVADEEETQAADEPLAGTPADAVPAEADWPWTQADEDTAVVRVGKIVATRWEVYAEPDSDDDDTPTSLGSIERSSSGWHLRLHPALTPDRLSVAGGDYWHLAPMASVGARNRLVCAVRAGQQYAAAAQQRSDEHGAYLHRLAR